MKVCPDCLAEFEDRFNFCRHDGITLQPKAPGKLCPRCGKEVGEAKRFCRHCGASLEVPTKEELKKLEETLIHEEKKPEISRRSEASPVEVAENYLKEGNLQGAISALEPVLKHSPENQEARLLHLLASVKRYNIYGYERQIESIKHLPHLSEKERGLAREIFLIRFEEARKGGRENEAREYQGLAAKVAIGQPLSEPDMKSKGEKAPIEKGEPTSLPQKKAERVPRDFPEKASAAPEIIVKPVRETSSQQKKVANRLWMTVGIVLGIAGLLGGGMLAYYAKSRGLTIQELLGKMSSGKQQPGRGAVVSSKGDAPQVVGAEELGFKVWGEGTGDPNRQVSAINELIKSQLAGLRQLYERGMQQKPDLMGSVILQLTISPSGAVTKVEEFASRVKDKEFKKAVINEVYKWRFPEASSGLVKVNYPLLFVPPGMDVATLVKWEQVVGPKSAERDEPTRFAGGDGERQPTQPVTITGSASSGTVQAPPPTASPRPSTQQSGQKVVKVIIGPYEVLYPTSVYSEPREDSQRVAQVQAGTKINVVDVYGDWLEVRSKHGNPPGFIKKDSAVPWVSR